MKILMIDNSIISLENVRRVERRITDTKHTSYGKAYTLTHYELAIIYCGSNNYTDNEHIQFGTGNEAKAACDKTFNEIYKILSEG